MLHGALRKRDHLGLYNFFGGERAVSLAACGDATGMSSVLLTVDPLEEGVEQEITAKNAKREEQRK